MNAGARKLLSVGAGRWSCALLLSFGAMPIVSTAQGGGVTLRIELKAESVDDVRAWRRALGLDPPDACGESPGAARPLSADAQRRLRRTFVLDEQGVWQPLVPDRNAIVAADCVRAPRAP